MTNGEYVHRTIPSDILQAKGLVYLCREYDWDYINIVHVEDAYGERLSLEIQEIADNYDIRAKRISLSYEQDEVELSKQSFEDAAKAINASDSFVSILIIHSTNLSALFFDALREEGVMGYPYYYIAVDSWLDNGALDDMNVTEYGFIGTAPGAVSMLDITQYNENDANFEDISEAYEISQNLLNLHYERYALDNGSYKEPSTALANRYDAVFVLAHAIEVMDQIGFNWIEMVRSNDEILLNQTIWELNRIIVNNVSFIGATGRLAFNQYGDRIEGIYFIGNVAEEGYVEFTGYFYEDPDGELVVYFNKFDIIFPPEFEAKGIYPVPEPYFEYELETIDSAISLVMIISLGISILNAAVCIIYLIHKRKDRVIKAASWKMNIIMCIGAILMYMTGILYAMDEGFDFLPDVSCSGEDSCDENDGFMDNKKTWTIMCESRASTGMIAFTLIFMPLFAKTYRLSVVFKSILQKKKFQDFKLFCLVFIAILVDIILLTVLSIIQPLRRNYYNGDQYQRDEIRIIQYIYGICESENAINDYLHPSLYVLLFAFKGIELICVLYVAFDVSRINDITNMLTRFNETGIQLLSILLTVIILCIAIPIFAFGPTEDPDFSVLLITITIFLIGNIVILLNLCPRICAVVRNKQDDYTKSQASKLEDRIVVQLNRYSSHDTDDYASTGQSGRVSSLRARIRTSSKLTVSRDKSPVAPLTPSFDAGAYTTEEEPEEVELAGSPRGE